MDIRSKAITALPHTSGVYMYKNVEGVVIYVGKAIDIQKRVRQYFDRSAQLSPKTRQLVEHIATIDHIKTISEFDAILLEAKLISSLQPKYNIIAKDDKSPIYIRIPMRDKLPIVSLIRKPKQQPVSRTPVLIGPFQSSRVATHILSTLRTIIPYCRQKIRKGKPCFYTHLGLCNPCPSEIVAMDPAKQAMYIHRYRININLLKDVLQGKSVRTRKILEHTMNTYAKEQNFEKAAYIRNQIQHLDNLLQTHFDPSLYATLSSDIGETIDNELYDLQSILAPYYGGLSVLNRIECIDISQLSGDNPVGSLVVLDQGIVNTSLYRKFAIKHIPGQNDTEMIKQVIKRRFNHPEWQFPDLLIVDGGKGQVTAAYEAVAEIIATIPIIGLAKRFEHIIVREGSGYKELHIPTTRPALHIIQRIRDESHRFAHAYHILKRRKAFLEEI